MTLIDMQDKFCKELCKYNRTTDEHGQCLYMRANRGHCPLDKITEVVENYGEENMGKRG